MINPCKTEKQRNILLSIFSHFVAVGGNGQQQANNKSAFKNAKSFSTVSVPVITNVRFILLFCYRCMRTYDSN